MSVTEGALNTPDGRRSGHCSRINVTPRIKSKNGIPHGNAKEGDAGGPDIPDRVRPTAHHGEPELYGGQDGYLGEKGKLLCF